MRQQLAAWRAAGGPVFGRLHTGPCFKPALLLGEAYVGALGETGVAHGISAHPRMPDVTEQAAVAGAVEGQARVVRWNLYGGFRCEQARQRYRPFDRLRDPDPDTRAAIVDTAIRSLRERCPVLVTVNSKAEGSAPLSVIELAKVFAAACESGA